MEVLEFIIGFTVGSLPVAIGMIIGYKVRRNKNEDV